MDDNVVIDNFISFYYDGYKYHLVSTVFDKDSNTTLYVLKYYGKHKQWWHYEIWEQFDLDDRIECGLITKISYNSVKKKYKEIKNKVDI